jgi:spermidine synthase
MHALFALAMLVAVWAVNRLPYWYLDLNALWEPRTLAGVIGMQMTILCVVLVPAVLCAGTILPLALVAALPAGASGAGSAVGRVYAVNTVGAIVGALLAGFVLLPRLGSQATLLGVCLCAALLGGAFALWARPPRWMAAVAAGSLALVTAGVVFHPTWNYLELHTGVFEPGRISGTVTDTLTEPGEETLFHREGTTASVLVSRRPSGTRSLLINARVNASDNPGDMMTQVLLAQVPLLLAPRTADVFVLGWGSGVTAGSALEWPATQITAVELEPAVVEASDLYRHVNHDARRNPRLQLYEDDARHLLLASEQSYDVIISEPAHPWVSGVANLFTRDFYEIAARRVRPDGVFAQWLQAYQISPDSFRAIMAAFHAVFPEVLAFRTPNGFDVILVGAHRPLALSLADIERRWTSGGAQAEMARVGLDRPEALLATFYLDRDAVAKLTTGARINTDDNLFVEFRGPREMVEEMQTNRISALLEQHAVPIDQALADGEMLTGSPERLRALIDALAAARRPRARYERLLAAQR